MARDVIISPDTRRAARLPPGQRRVVDWPMRHKGSVPPFDPATWDLTLFPVPMVERVVRLSWPEFLDLPRVKVFADMHSASGWSRLDNLWEGVATRELLNHIALSDSARFVMIHGEQGYTTNLSLSDFFAEDALLALEHDGGALEPEHGGPVRLIVPRLYAWKSAKWVRGIEFMTEDRPGYWERPENGGYPMRGDPWRAERPRCAAGSVDYAQ